MTTQLVVSEHAGEVRVGVRTGQMLSVEFGPPEPFLAPLSASELEDLRWYLEDYLSAPYAVYEQSGARIECSLPDWGIKLFESLFGAGRKARDRYQRVMGRVDAGEAVELHFSSAAPAFLGLPWELMRDPARPSPLTLDFQTVLRTIAADAPPREVPGGARLRVLLAIARPDGPKDIGYRSIARPLFRCVESVAGKVLIDVLRPATATALEEALVRAENAGEPYHILHFDGHGTFGAAVSTAGSSRSDMYDRTGPQGFLAFEGMNGGSDLVSAERLARLLKRFSVPVFILNACRSGTFGAGVGPEATVATRLIQEGAAAVVAMSYAVYVVAAAEFMAAFYQALFEGRPLSHAVSAGRTQLHQCRDRPSPKGPIPLEDWVVPVLYARSEVIFPELKRPTPSAPGAPSLSDSLEQLRGLRESATGDELGPQGGVFVGRDAEFYELEQVLRLRRGAVIHGLGGSGKTELAKAFARWWSASGALDNPRYVFLHSFEPGVASFGLDQVVTRIGLSIFGSDFIQRAPSPDDRASLIADVLAKHRTLLVWDNFETVQSMPDPTSATPPLDAGERDRLRTFVTTLVATGRSAILITSRSQEPWLGDDIHRLNLGGFAPHDANQYAERLLVARPAARPKREQRAYAELIESLDGHPLSLRLMLPHLEKRSPAELLAALRGTHPLPAASRTGSGRIESLDRSVDYSFRHISPRDRERLPALSLFEGVADADVLAMFSEEDAIPARFRDVSKEEWERLLNECAGLGLLAGRGGGMFEFHPALPSYLTALWRELAREAFESEYEESGGAFLLAHARLGSWLVQQIQRGDASFAMKVIDVQRRTMGRVLSRALDCREWTAAQAVLQPLSIYWDTRGLIAEAGAWCDRCRVAVEGSGGEPPNLATAAGALWSYIVINEANRVLLAGDTDRAAAEYDAVRIALEGTKSEGTRPLLGVLYHQLGMVAQRRRQPDEAEHWYRLSLEISGEHGNHAAMSTTYHQLGSLERDRGEFVHAGQLYHQSLELRKNLGDGPGVAASLHALGLVAQHLGQLEEAERLYRLALETKRELDDRLGMSSSYHQLGMVARQLWKLDEAKQWYLRSLAIEEDLRNRPGIAMSYHQLGVVALLQSEFEEAEGWCHQAMAIFDKLGDRSGMAKVCHQLGVVAEFRGDFDAGRRLYLQSLDIKVESNDRVGMASSLGALGFLALKRGAPFEALDWMVRCMALFDEFPHPATGPVPEQLVGLTATLGMPALEESFLRLTDRKLPAGTRAAIENAIVHEESPK